MQLLLIEDENDVYRVRKEEIGCSIFTPRSYIEGDDVLFDVLCTLHEQGVPAGIEALKKRYQADAGQIEADLQSMAEGLLANEVLCSMSREIQTYLSEERPA